MVAAGSEVWAASPTTGVLVRLSGDGEVRRIQLRGAPISLALTPATLWVAERDAERVVAVGTSSLAQTSSTMVPLPAAAIAGAQGVWVLSLDAGSLDQLNPRTGAIGRELDVPVSKPVAVVEAAGELWVLGAGEQGLSPINPAVGGSVRAGFDQRGAALSGLSAGGGAIWLGETSGRSILRVNATSGNVRKLPAPDGMRPVAISVGECGVWIAGASGEVTIIDPQSASPLTPPIHVGRSIGAIAASGAGVWVSDPLNGDLVRIELRATA